MLETPQRIIVVGGSGGIGLALVRELVARFPLASIDATHHTTEIPLRHERIAWQQLDVRNPEAMQTWSRTFNRVDWLINCAGFLHGDQGGPEKSIRFFDPDFLIENIRINALPTMVMARDFSRAFKQSPAPILATISARVGSIADNRLGGWYSYRVSKAALNMALKTLSIEWKHSHPTGSVVSLHPGTNDTSLSKPFQSSVAPQNLRDPAATATSFIDLLSDLEPGQTDNFLAWDGERIAW